MNTISKKKSITAAFVMFVLVIAMIIVVITPIQIALGMTGVLITELIFLAMALVGALIMKTPLREVFPIHKPHIRQIFGSVLLWIAGLLLVLFSTILIGYFFPDELGATQEGLSDVITSVPFIVRFLIVAVSPAICEEAVHRGFILHFLKPIQKKWAIVLIVGILFGIFHLDPTRFPATAILGMVLTYAALETGNMFYPFLIHFLNNTLSVIATGATENLDTAAISPENTFTLSAVGIYLVLLCIAPWLLWAGVTLLHPKKTEKSKKSGKIILACTLTSGLCIVGGFLLASGDMNMTSTGVQTPTVAELSQTPFSTDLDIDSGRQQLTVVMETPQGLLRVSITDDNGNVVYEETAGQLTGNFPLELTSGHYTLTVELVEAGSEADSSEELVTFQIILMQM